jgi:hypothetical protein
MFTGVEIEVENASRVEMPTLVSSGGRTSDCHSAVPNPPVELMLLKMLD